MLMLHINVACLRRNSSALVQYAKTRRSPAYADIQSMTARSDASGDYQKESHSESLWAKSARWTCIVQTRGVTPPAYLLVSALLAIVELRDTPLGHE